jgi:hypothetical protein
MATNPNSRVEILKLVLADVEKERDRLRDARASWTARLGPLPASAAVVTGIVAAAQGKVDWWWAAGAGLIFIVLLAVSVGFAGLEPYRELRKDCQGKFDPSWAGRCVGFRRHEADLAEWLLSKIKLEEHIYGPLGERKCRWWPTRNVKSLGEALDSERAAANIVQGLFVAIFVVLVIGIAA